MVRIARLLLALAFLAAASEGHAQAPAPTTPATPAPAGSGEPDFLKTMPRPPDEPRSLYLPPAPPGGPTPDLERPYFQPDPLLDPPQLPPPGWFVDAQAVILKPHLRNDLVGFVRVGTHSSNNASSDNTNFDTVRLDAAPLNWTVSPRLEVGYRLPSGFGAIALAYRGLSTQGTASVTGPDAPAALTSRLNFNQADLDYVSREFSLWPKWEMKWRVGVRLSAIYFDSRQVEPFAAAAAGGGIFDVRDTDHWVGMGPHAGLELARKFDPSGQWSGLIRTDFTTMIGRQRQGFFEVSTTPGPGGLPLAGDTHVSGSQDVPIAHLEVGINWHPYREVFLFVGYQYEYWWNVGRLNLEGSHGYFYDQGVVLQGQINF